MWKKLTLIAALVSLAALLVLPSATTVAKPPPKTVPGGPGLIAMDIYWDGYIALINPDGTGAVSVALEDGLSSFRPAWSPRFSDGTVKLAYPGYHFTTQTGHLNVLNVFDNVGVVGATPQLSLRGPTRVLDGIHTTYNLDWSPAEPEVVNGIWTGRDKVRVAYDVYYSRQSEVIYIWDLIYDTRDQSFSVDPASPLPAVLDPGSGAYAFGARYMSPQFSPDGQWLALYREDGLPDGTWHYSIWLAKADGLEDPRVLIDAGPGVESCDPAWSPLWSEAGGYQLAFVRGSYQRSKGLRLLVGDLYVVPLSNNMDVGPIRRLTQSDTIREQCPTWSPDGTQIAFWAPYALGKVVDLTSGTAVEYNLGAGYRPDWSPMNLPRLP